MKMANDAGAPLSSVGGIHAPLSSQKMKPMGEMTNQELRDLIANPSMMERVKDLARDMLRDRGGL